jgi:hypothetical protein
MLFFLHLMPAGSSLARFDAFVLTERAERPDPCADLRKRMRPPSAP